MLKTLAKTTTWKARFDAPQVMSCALYSRFRGETIAHRKYLKETKKPKTLKLS
jgi:hypothetical protein